MIFTNYFDIKWFSSMLFFFGYWTYISMEIFKWNVVFFWLLDLYQYGNFEKKCCFFFGYWTYISMEIFKKNVVFFGYWTYISMEIFKKMLFFFGYWTYISMEIFIFFWLLDLYQYGKCLRELLCFTYDKNVYINVFVKLSRSIYAFLKYCTTWWIKTV